MSNNLTSDNPYLSRPTLPVGSQKLAELVATYVRDSLAENSRRAYLSDLAHFENWGGSLPSSDKMLASYFASHAETFRVATLVRRLTSISKAHEARGYESPARSSLVKATLRGIKRRQGIAQRQAKPLLKEDLIAVLDAMGDTLRDAIEFRWADGHNERITEIAAEFVRLKVDVIVTYGNTCVYRKPYPY